MLDFDQYALVPHCEALTAVLNAIRVLASSLIDIVYF